MQKELPNVGVACVEPGIVETEMLRYAGSKISYLAEIPGIKPEVCAKFLAYLLSENVSKVQFSSEIWSIYETTHQANWASPEDENLANPFS